MRICDGTHPSPWWRDIVAPSLAHGNVPGHKTLRDPSAKKFVAVSVRRLAVRLGDMSQSSAIQIAPTAVRRICGTVGATLGAVTVGSGAAATGAAIGALAGGPPGAGIGYLVGLCAGAAGGAVAGARGGALVGGSLVGMGAQEETP
jgi:hypothetical protein